MTICIVGFPYLDALQALRQKGRVVSSLSLTRPPRARIGVGTLRVVQQREERGGVKLTVAYEDYEE